MRRQVADWLKPYEERRRLMGISGEQLSVMLGRSRVYWYRLRRLTEPPYGWLKIKQKLEEILYGNAERDIECGRDCGVCDAGGREGEGVAEQER